MIQILNLKHIFGVSHLSEKNIYELKQKLNSLIRKKSIIEKEILEVNNRLDTIIGEIIQKNTKDTANTE